MVKVHNSVSITGKLCLNSPNIKEHMIKTGEWGEFPPLALSPFAYNESVAHEYFPLAESEAKKRGLRWRDKKDSSKKFVIQPAEKKFYEKMGLPEPTNSFSSTLTIVITPGKGAIREE